MGKADQGVQTSTGRYTVVPRVLTFVFSGQDVLLLKGAPTKRIWANRYNGIGGHVEAAEDIYTAARRETAEETGLRVKDLRLRGVVHIDAGGITGILMFVFSARSDQRQTQPSEEGALEWVPLDHLDGRDLVEDLPVLLRRIAGMPDDAPPFFARYWYDADDRLCMAFAGQDGPE
jgi:8-oxo-dGTP diphosphatase